MSTIPMPSARRSGLVASMLVGVIAASVVSIALVFVLPGGAGSIDQSLPQTGPLGMLISTIVPFVWVGLFAGLGAAFWLVSGGRSAPSRAGWWIIGLLALCVLYPVLSSGVSRTIIVIIGNIITVMTALIAARACWTETRLAALFPSLVAAWVSLATTGLLALMLGLPF